MLTKLLSGKSFFVQIILGILFLVLFLIRNYPFSTDPQMVIGIVIYLLAVGVNLMFLENTELIKEKNIAEWFFISGALTFSGIAQDYKIGLVLLLNTFLIWHFLSINRGTEKRAGAFGVGFLLSISSLIYPPNIFLAGFFLYTYLFLQNANFKKFLLLIIGILLPILIGLQLAYLTDRMDLVEPYESAFCVDIWSSKAWVLIGLGIFLAISWIDHITHLTVQNISKRYQYLLLFLYFLNWVIILILYAGDHTDLLIILMLPITVFITRLVQYAPQVLKEITLWAVPLIMASFFFREEIIRIYNDLLGNVQF